MRAIDVNTLFSHPSSFILLLFSSSSSVFFTPTSLSLHFTLYLGITKKRSFNKQKVNTEQILRSTKCHCDATSQHNLYHNTHITIQYFVINHKASYSHCKQYKHNLASALKKKKKNIYLKQKPHSLTLQYILLHYKLMY